jgi:hypothetical protein
MRKKRRHYPPILEPDEVGSVTLEQVMAAIQKLRSKKSSKRRVATQKKVATKKRSTTKKAA